MQFIDHRQETLEEVEPILLEAMQYVQPSRQLNSINGSVLSEDSLGRAQFYKWNGMWVLRRTVHQDPHNPIVIYYRNPEEVVESIGESDPWYIEVQMERNGPHYVLWDARPSIRAGPTGLEEMFGQMRV